MSTPAAAPAPPSGDRVVHYYHHTWIDYRLVWLTGRNLAMHFGYDAEGQRDHHGAVENANRVCADIAQVRRGDRVLDAGCGVGGSSCWLAAARGAEVVGITIVPSQARRASRVAAARGLGHRVRFEVADYLATPFPDRSFDVAWAMESLCHAADKPAFYREMARLLKPGGRLVVAEYMRVSHGLPARAERDMRRWCEGWAMPDLDTPEAHCAGARAAGFDHPTVQDGTPHTRKSLRRLYRHTHVGIPLDLVLYALGLRSDAQHRNVIASRIQYQLLRQGHWLYGILSATMPARDVE
jgi:cyclopropane fatty-acyl-phospholipid synthase-like methyltransferase